DGQSVIQRFLVWNVNDEAVFWYPAMNFLFDGFTVRGTGFGTGVNSGDYDATDLTYKNFDFRGIDTGFRGTKGGGTITMQDGYLQVTTAGLGNESLRGPGSGVPSRSRKTIWNNVKVDPWKTSTPKTVAMWWGLSGGDNSVAKDEVYVYNYQQVQGTNFQV